MQDWFSKITDHTGITKIRLGAVNFNQEYIDELKKLNINGLYIKGWTIVVLIVWIYSYPSNQCILPLKV